MRTVISFRKYAREPIAFLKTKWGDLEIFNWETKLGRNSNNDLVLSDLWVSRRHGRIVYDINNHRFLFRDHSANGTYVNGMYVHNGSVPLPPRAEIEIKADESVTKMTFEATFGALVDPAGHIHIIPTGKELVVGKEGTVIVPVEHKYVSRRHIIIRFHPELGHYELEDFSANGSHVNKKFVHHAKCILRDGDQISLANQYKFKFIHVIPEAVLAPKRKVVEPAAASEVAWRRVLGKAIVDYIPEMGWAKYNLQLIPKYTSWKIHVYIDNEEDLFNIGKALIPILRTKGIMFKTKQDIHFRQTGAQLGKLFVIYLSAVNPEDIREVRLRARQLGAILESILSKPRLRARHHYHIVGDRAVPGDKSGRLFYRYDSDRQGPGPQRPYSERKYRVNGFSSHYNISNNPDIF